MRLFASVGLVAYLILCASPAFAQDHGSALPPPGSGAEGSGSTPITAVISGLEDAAVGETVLLDASASRLVRQNVSYRWYLDEQLISRSGELLYTPDKPGVVTFRLVINSDIDGEVRESRAEHALIAYRRKVLLLADDSVPLGEIDRLVAKAAAQGDHLRVLRAVIPSLPLGAEDALFNQLMRSPGALRGAESVIVWTRGVAGLQALARAARTQGEQTISLADRTLLLVTEQNARPLSRLARGLLSNLGAPQMFIMDSEAVDALLASSSRDAFLSAVKQQDIPLTVIDAAEAGFRPWEVAPFLVREMTERGVDSQTVILLLMLPIIATIFAFLKQIIGITSFGLYTPSIITLSFVALGWQVGVLFLVFIVLTGYLTRMLMRDWRLLYIPKVAITLTVVSITLLLLIAAGEFLGVTLAPNAVFMLLIMSTLAENVLNVKLEEGWRTAILGISETILGALACVALIRWPAFQSLIFAYPELILLTILINVGLGRWTGLRVVEYFRFKEVFRHLQEE